MIVLEVCQDEKLCVRLEGVVLKACDCIWQTKRGFSLWGLINWGGTPPRYINQGGPTHVSIAKTFFLCGVD